jgi:hypothetical protein
MKIQERLSQYLYAVVRFECIFCPWLGGVYRLARLAERSGAEGILDHVRQQIRRLSPASGAQTYMSPFGHVWCINLLSHLPNCLPKTYWFWTKSVAAIISYCRSLLSRTIL